MPHKKFYPSGGTLGNCLVVCIWWALRKFDCFPGDAATDPILSRCGCGRCCIDSRWTQGRKRLEKLKKFLCTRNWTCFNLNYRRYLILNKYKEHVCEGLFIMMWLSRLGSFFLAQAFCFTAGAKDDSPICHTPTWLMALQDLNDYELFRACGPLYPAFAIESLTSY